MKKKPARRRSTQQAIIRALTRNLGVAADVISRMHAQQGAADGDKFVHCWAVYGRPVTQALDASGQVWELHTIMDQATKTVSEQFWTPLGMERRGGK